MEKKPSSGYFRKQLYDYIAKVIGRDLTEPEHDALKGLMDDYVRHFGEEMAQIPRKHIYTCKKCLFVVEKVGKQRNGEFVKKNRNTIERT